MAWPMMVVGRAFGKLHRRGPWGWERAASRGESGVDLENIWYVRAISGYEKPVLMRVVGVVLIV